MRVYVYTALFQKNKGSFTTYHESDDNDTQYILQSW